LFNLQAREKGRARHFKKAAASPVLAVFMQIAPSTGSIHTIFTRRMHVYVLTAFNAKVGVVNAANATLEKQRLSCWPETEGAFAKAGSTSFSKAGYGHSRAAGLMPAACQHVSHEPRAPHAARTQM
jgi:hypothetical protein